MVAAARRTSRATPARQRPGAAARRGQLGLGAGQVRGLAALGSRQLSADGERRVLERGGALAQALAAAAALEIAVGRIGSAAASSS